MKGRLWIGVSLVILLGIFFMNSVSAQGFGGNLSQIANDSDYVLIDVNVTTVTMIDVQPYALAWNVSPGGVGDNDSESLGPGYFAIQIENIGSHNITRIWLNATYPTASPFARGSAAYTDAGNYVVISNDTSSTNPPAKDFWFINRVEYNETRQLVYLRDPSGNLPPDGSTYTYGRFRNSSREYFWFINKVPPNCNESGTQLRIGRVAHTVTQTGTTNFQDGAEGVRYDTFTLNNYDGEYAVGNIDTGPLSGYAVAVNASCAVFFSKWNRDYPFDFIGTNAVYVNNVTSLSDSNFLYPGDSIALAIKVYVPYGIYEGPSNQGKIWIIVSDVP